LFAMLAGLAAIALALCAVALVLFTGGVLQFSFVVTLAGGCLSILTLAAGGAGIGMGFAGLRRVASGRATNRGVAWAGILCGIVGIVLLCVAVVAAAVLSLDLLAFEDSADI
jgi:hypothetical protein